MHQTIKKVSEDIEAFKFNTAVAQMMTFLNVIEKETISRADFLLFIQVLAPFAPFVTEELWNQLTSNFSIHTQIGQCMTRTQLLIAKRKSPFR
ncbi:MAG: class I tRNA ligase family protein [Flavobacteriales bacterium]|nr:class I tRNA ligase family protein [Flavobacteriales bacterium]